MPELPEVETFARGLDFALRGLRVESVALYREKNVKSDLASFASSLLEAKFLSVSRRGKYLIFHLDNGSALLSHLRMEGRWKALEGPFSPSPYAILALTLSDGRTLVYEDSRKFGTLEIKKESELFSSLPLSALGEEPLDISFPSFFAGLSRKRVPIKEALLDQTFLAGIGNIYADESLFASGIHPLQKSDALDETRAKALYEEMRRILRLAISLRGSSIHSYVATFETEPSSMQEKLEIYGQAHRSCPRCGSKTTFIQVAGRGTTFCPLCQKRTDAPFRLAVTGPIHSGKSTAASYFRERGFPCFDADETVAKLYETPDVLAALRERFGKKAVKKRAANRPFLRDLFSRDQKAKEAWTGYLYPRLLQEFRRFEKEHRGAEALLLDVPLLLSSPFKKEFDALLLIEADEEIRRQRIEKEGRDASALLAINASYPLRQTEKIATFVVKNEGDVPSFFASLEQVRSTIAKCLEGDSPSGKGK